MHRRLRTAGPATKAVAHRLLRPNRALVDPVKHDDLPRAVVAASGFDVLCHALGSPRWRVRIPAPAAGGSRLRPLSQGPIPIVTSAAAKRWWLCGGTCCALAADDTRREQLLSPPCWLIAFGNAGVHAPHGMAYAVMAVRRKWDRRLPGGAAAAARGLGDSLSAGGVLVPSRPVQSGTWKPPDFWAQSCAAPPWMMPEGARPPLRLMAAGQQPRICGGRIPRCRSAAVRAAARLQRRLLDNAPRPIDDQALDRFVRRRAASTPRPGSGKAPPPANPGA